MDEKASDDEYRIKTDHLCEQSPHALPSWIEQESPNQLKKIAMTCPDFNVFYQTWIMKWNITRTIRQESNHYTRDASENEHNP